MATSEEALNWLIYRDPHRMHLCKVKVERLVHFYESEGADCDEVMMAGVKGVPNLMRASSSVIVVVTRHNLSGGVDT